MQVGVVADKEKGGCVNIYGGVSRNGMVGTTYSTMTDRARYDLIAQGARFYEFVEFLASVELNFEQRLFFVEVDDRIYAVMAYSKMDAVQQVHWARIHKQWNPFSTKGWFFRG